MELAPDFFSYFQALAPLLDRDPKLMCISSWNDHGQARPPAGIWRCVSPAHACQLRLDVTAAFVTTEANMRSFAQLLMTLGQQTVASTKSPS